ncbi:MAG: asparagine synthase-related protein [Acidimicrobiales bacterium]
MNLIGGVVTWKTPTPDVSGLAGSLGAAPVHGWRGGLGPGRVIMLSAGAAGADPSLSVAASGTAAATGGRLAGSRRLAAELGLSPGCDADVALGFYLRRGPAAIGRLGDIALAVVDPEREMLMLAVGPAAATPLCVWRNDEMVAFASHALALTGLQAVGHHLDERRAVEMAAGLFAGERTLVAGVSRIPPGTMLLCRADGVTSRRWWRPRDVVDDAPIDDHATRLRGALEEAVADALDDAASPGVLLSGGLDSASVAAVAVELHDGPVRSYTSVPPPGWTGDVGPGWVADERSAVEALAARHPTLRTTFTGSDSGDVFVAHEKFWELGGVAARNVANALWYDAAHAAAAGDGVDVVLVGEEGNLAFSADGPEWLVELLREGRPVRLLHEARARGRLTGTTLAHVLRRDLLSPLVPARVRRRLGRVPMDDAIRRWRSAWAVRPGARAILGDDDVAGLFTGATSWRAEQVDVSLRSAAAHAETSQARALLTGAVTRDPLADRRVLDAALAQPETVRRVEGVDRAVCRRAMRDLVPAEILDRRTRGAQLPDWFERFGEMRTVFEEQVAAARGHALSSEIIDVDRLAGILDGWPDVAPRGRQASELRFTLPRALMVSAHLRWFERRRDRPLPTAVVEYVKPYGTRGR